MRKRFLFILILLVGLIAVIMWLAHKPLQTTLQSPTNALASSQFSPNNGVVQTVQKQQAKSQAIIPAPTVSSEELEFVRKTRQDPTYEWKQPINFWGRVMDNSNNIVADANVHFIWNDLSLTGTSETDAKSDSDGGFSLISKTGKGISITVSKDGYYSTRQSFEYAEPANKFNPDPNNPVIFHLRKKGVGADLIISQARIVSPTNGTPVFFDFLNGKTGNSGQLEIKGWKEHKDFKTGQNNWGLRLTIPDGGFIEENDEFPFEAPDTDYQSVVEWHFTDGSIDWRGYLKTNFYIKFGNPPDYGRISIDTTAFYPAVRIEYVINPDGSRNLEPK